MKKGIIVVLSALLLASACDRSRKGPLAFPSTPISSLSGSISIMDKADFPYTDVYAKILDNNSNPVTDLKIANISITEEGNPCIPLDIEESLSPLSIVLVLDRSGSMGDAGAKALNAAAVGFVDKLSSRDFVEIIEFGSTVEVKQIFTNSKSTLKDAINSGKSDKGFTAFYDAVGKAVDDIIKVGGNRVIIAMTDGVENTSVSYDLTSITAYAVLKNLNINTIGYGAFADPSLSQLASDTGGVYAYASTGDELYNVYQQLIPVAEEDHVKVRFRSLHKKAASIEMYVMYGGLTAKMEKEYIDTD